VKLKLIAEERRQLTRNAPTDAEAHDQYLRGRYHYARFNLFDAQKAVAYFQQARERDPSFGLAHCGLADALMVFTLSGDVATKEVSPTAKSAIAQALRLDPESAEAHTSDSSIKFWFDWDYSRGGFPHMSRPGGSFRTGTPHIGLVSIDVLLGLQHLDQVCGEIFLSVGSPG